MSIPVQASSASAGPRVSIVLCGYNQAAYLEHSIASALNQTHRNIELIVVDNGSTDGSQELAERYRSDPRVRLLLHPRNGPVTQKLNEAIAAATGEYVSLLYADDYYLPHKIERQLQAFSTLPPDYGVVYAPGYREDEASGRRWLDRTLKVSGWILKDMFDLRDEGFINPIAPLLRKQCFIDFPFHEDLFVEGECIFWRIAMTHKFHYLDEPLIVMREHAGNIGKAVKLNAQMVLTVYDKLEREPAFPRGLLHDLNTLRGDFIGGCAWLGIRLAGDPRWARSCVRLALRWQPRQIVRPRMLATMGLCLAPETVVRVFNRVLNAALRRNETVGFRADYS